MKKILFFIALFLVIFNGNSLYSATPATAQLQQNRSIDLITQPHFLKVFFNSTHCGWSSVREEQGSMGVITHLEDVLLTIEHNREVRSVSQITIYEDRNGHIRRHTEIYKENDQFVEKKDYHIDDNNQMSLTLTHADGSVQKQLFSLKEPLLGPHHLRTLFIQKQPFKANDVIHYYFFDFMLGVDGYYTLTYKTSSTHQIQGKACPVYQFNVKIQNMGHDFFGEDHYLANGLHFYNRLYLMTLVSERSFCSNLEQAKAQAQPIDFNENFTFAAPDLSSVFEQNPQTVYYTIKTTSEIVAKLRNDSIQSVSKTSKPDIWTLKITQKQPTEDMTFPYQGDDSEALQALQETITLDFNHPDIQNLKQKLQPHLKSVEDAYSAAQKISQFVMLYISDKNYEHIYDYASQVARNRSGDCTEHSVLATALCRSFGIPARPVFGLVYQQNSENPEQARMIGHQWFEVWINGQWYPLDPAQIQFSPKQIRVCHGNGELTDNLQLVKMFDYLRAITILDATLQPPKEK